MFAIGPSTLAQGQTLVRQAGGNTTLALMLLVMTNTIAVFIAPFLIKAMLASQAASVKLDSAHLLTNLVITVLAPSIVGKARDPSSHRRLCSSRIYVSASCERGPYASSATADLLRHVTLHTLLMYVSIMVVVPLIVKMVDALMRSLLLVGPLILLESNWGNCSLSGIAVSTAFPSQETPDASLSRLPTKVASTRLFVHTMPQSMWHTDSCMHHSSM